MPITIQHLEDQINIRALKKFNAMLSDARQAVIRAAGEVAGEDLFYKGTEPALAFVKLLLEHGTAKDAATHFPALFKRIRDGIVDDFLGATEAVRALAEGREFE